MTGNDDLDQLADELADFAVPEGRPEGSVRNERVLAGFAEITDFVASAGRLPQHGEGREIFERLYAVRLERIAADPDLAALVAPHDIAGLLQRVNAGPSANVDLDEDDLMAELADLDQSARELTTLRHVQPRAAARALAEEIGRREPCPDFDQFKPLFEKVQRELKSGVRKALLYSENPGIDRGDFIILNGVMGYIHEIGDSFVAPNGQTSARLRLIFANGTESNMLLTSLQRAFLDDPAGRRLTGIDNGPLFGDSEEVGDVTTGTIYVLRSNSDHPLVSKNRDLIHKIGVTGGAVTSRISGAADQPTYLLSTVEVVTTYKLVGINRVKMENLLHRIFRPAQIDIEIQDRFGKPFRPREWFLVPLHAIDEAIDRIRDGSIEGYHYDAKEARFISVK